MDPPLIHESSFSAANPSSYTLSGIWPFAGAASAAVSGAGLGLRIGALGGPYDSSDQRDASAEESTVTDLSASCFDRKRKDLSLGDDSSKIVSTSSSAADLNGSNGKRIKAQGCKKGNGSSKLEVEASAEAGGTLGPSSKPPEPRKDYIHVRARRGQATDSHSLAERARREKISERMTVLQDLVPGCSKVIGKALVLDEIINYVQSLQRQIELLSMKLEVVNSRIDINPNSESLHPKDVLDTTGILFGSQVAKEYVEVPQFSWLHMGGNFDRTS